MRLWRKRRDLESKENRFVQSAYNEKQNHRSQSSDKGYNSGAVTGSRIQEARPTTNREVTAPVSPSSNQSAPAFAPTPGNTQEAHKANVHDPNAFIRSAQHPNTNFAGLKNTHSHPASADENALFRSGESSTNKTQATHTSPCDLLKAKSQEAEAGGSSSQVPNTRCHLNSVSEATSQLARGNPIASVEAVKPAVTPQYKSDGISQPALVALVMVPVLILISAAGFTFYLYRRRTAARNFQFDDADIYHPKFNTSSFKAPVGGGKTTEGGLLQPYQIDEMVQSASDI